MSSKEYYRDLKERADEFEKCFNSPAKNTCSMNELTRVAYLGQGAFGTVFLVQHKPTKKYYALKVLNKQQVVRSGQILGAINEKKMLASVKSDFVINLVYSFKDTTYLHLVIDFILGGEMYELLVSLKCFNDKMTRFYSAQIILVFEYLHYMNIAYRDLKPENVLMNADGYIKVADLGFAKKIPFGSHTWTVCGTPDYMAPEIILRKGYHVAVDWWAFGVMLYEMSSGFPPFMTSDTMKTFERIIAGKYKFNSNCSKNLKDIVKNLIQADLSCRYGNLKDGISDIKNHKFYSEIDWEKIYTKSVEPPFIPKFSDMNGVIKKLKGADTAPLCFCSEDKYAEEFKNF